MMDISNVPVEVKEEMGCMVRICHNNDYDFPEGTTGLVVGIDRRDGQRLVMFEPGRFFLHDGDSRFYSSSIIYFDELENIPSGNLWWVCDFNLEVIDNKPVDNFCGYIFKKVEGVD
jgi:hypothetical protein